jgi:hypothetical protein
MNEIFASLYEILGYGYFEGFSDDLFENKLYIPVGLSMLAISLLGVAIYYYIINHPHFNRWYHWALIVLIGCIANFGIAYSFIFNHLEDIYAQKNQDLPYSMEILNFSLLNSLWTLIASFVFSFIRKIGKWSYNCRNTPF